MTTEEWLEVVEWVNDRFTPGWTPDRAVAFGVDLKGYQAEDVWDGLYRLYGVGLEFAPNGSKLKVATVEAVRNRIEREKLERRGLGTGDTDLTWSAWRDRLGLEGLSVNDAARVRHGELFPNGCINEGCDVCGNLVVDSIPHTV